MKAGEMPVAITLELSLEPLAKKRSLAHLAFTFWKRAWRTMPLQGLPGGKSLPKFLACKVRVVESLVSMYYSIGYIRPVRHNYKF